MWQKSMDLVVEVYCLTEKYPKAELFGLVSQMRRCAVSIPSNIAEGRNRKSEKENRRFFVIAYGSGAELETQIEISKRLPFGEGIDFVKAEELLNETMKMLNKIINLSS